MMSVAAKPGALALRCLNYVGLDCRHGIVCRFSQRTVQVPSSGKPGAWRSGAPSQPAAIIAVGGEQAAVAGEIDREAGALVVVAVHAVEVFRRVEQAGRRRRGPVRRRGRRTSRPSDSPSPRCSASSNSARPNRTCGASSRRSMPGPGSMPKAAEHGGVVVVPARIGVAVGRGFGEGVFAVDDQRLGELVEHAIPLRLARHAEPLAPFLRRFEAPPPVGELERGIERGVFREAFLGTLQARDRGRMQSVSSSHAAYDFMNSAVAKTTSRYFSSVARSGFWR